MQQLVFFAKGRGRGIFGNFSPEVLHDYLAFHAAQATLAFVREHGEVAGLGIAWQMDPETIRRRYRGGRSMFEWEPNDAGAKGLWIANVVATSVPVRRGLLNGLMQRFPNWAQLEIYTTRRGRGLVRIPPLALARLMLGHEPAELREKLKL